MSAERPFTTTSTQRMKDQVLRLLTGQHLQNLVEPRFNSSARTRSVISVCSSVLHTAAKRLYPAATQSRSHHRSSGAILAVPERGITRIKKLVIPSGSSDLKAPNRVASSMFGPPHCSESSSQCILSVHLQHSSPISTLCSNFSLRSFPCSFALSSPLSSTSHRPPP